jgi:uncharacterized protein with HEPN domain
MPRERLALIYDALKAARLIGEFLRDKSFADYEESALLQSAVERQFEIVGESLNVARGVDPLLGEAITNLPGIVRNRNFLAHAYHAVVNERLWDTATQHLPLLVRELETILASEPPPSGLPLD